MDSSYGIAASKASKFCEALFQWFADYSLKCSHAVANTRLNLEIIDPYLD